MKGAREVIFAEYARKWAVSGDAVRIVFLLVDMHREYVVTARTLASLGFRRKPRELRYFYRKVMLTERYGDKRRIGKKNYRKMVTSAS
jgi:hypothetical protein